MTLVLDLNRTLVYTTNVRKSDYQFAVDIHLNKSSKYSTLYVFKRPNVDIFLSELYPIYEIVIYTTSKKEYASSIIDSTCISSYLDRKFCREFVKL